MTVQCTVRSDISSGESLSPNPEPVRPRHRPWSKAYKTRLRISSGLVPPSLPRPLLMTASVLLVCSLSPTAWANCVTSGNTVTCDTSAPNPYTSRIGNGPNSANDVTVNIGDGARINALNSAAISLRDGAVITLGANSSVASNITVRPGDPNYDFVVNGLYATNPWDGAGPNTIEFHTNNRLTVGVGATITGNGDPNSRAEAINVIGFGNVITNYGTISSINRPAIWFQDTAAAGRAGQHQHHRQLRYNFHGPRRQLARNRQ